MTDTFARWLTWIPASAGMTDTIAGMTDAFARWLTWIPASAGMTDTFAGMTDAFAGVREMESGAIGANL